MNARILFPADNQISEKCMKLLSPWDELFNQKQNMDGMSSDSPNETVQLLRFDRSSCAPFFFLYPPPSLPHCHDDLKCISVNMRQGYPLCPLPPPHPTPCDWVGFGGHKGITPPYFEGGDLKGIGMDGAGNWGL